MRLNKNQKCNKTKKSKKKVIVILGPTASGKTSFAKKIADPEVHEIINADSMQIYKEISIGNNKEIINKVKSHFFDICLVIDDYFVNDFQKEVRKTISKIHKKSKIPILVGGSGMYIASVIFKNYKFNYEKKYKKLNSLQIMDQKKKLGKNVEELQQKIIEKGFDIGKLNNSDKNNPRRLQNIFIKLKYGENNIFLDNHYSSDYYYNVDLHIFHPLRKKLKLKIEKRVKSMIKQGLINEVISIINKYGKENISSQVKSASGYKQVFDFLKKFDYKDFSLNNVKIKDLKKLEKQIINSHYQLSKKQITWNKKYFY